VTASTLAPADARAVLDQLAAGALNVLPAAARDTLRAEAERALHALVLAQVVEVHPASRRGGRTVVIDCPHCRKRHVHGFPFGDAAPGWRNAHCGRGRRSYFIPAPSGLEPGGAPGRGCESRSNATKSDRTALTSPDAVAGGHQKGAPR